ncbi:hypothetical protein EV175_006589, partial [Coemansia sp. RSA 1933]
MWAFLVFNIVLVFGFSGTFWTIILDVINRPATPMQTLASNIPRVGTFFAGYILVLGVGYQPFKLLQLRPVIWHLGRQWLCSTPRDYARLVSPVYIDWYSVYPYPLLVFTIAMVYSSFSPPVVLGAVVYFAIGYPVMKYLLLYVYFRPFETAGMAWPKVCRRMILSVILYQAVMLTFVIVKGGGWYSFGMVPAILIYLWFFYHVGWSLEKQGSVLPLYLWRNPPPEGSYPAPPSAADDTLDDAPADRTRSVPRSVANNTAHLILGSRHTNRRCRQGASSANIRTRRSGTATQSQSYAERKRLRYKCLAEAATVHGSRLIRSLTTTNVGRLADSGFIEQHQHSPVDEEEEGWEDTNIDGEEESWDPLLYLRPSNIQGSKHRLPLPPLLLSDIKHTPQRGEDRASVFASGVVNTPVSESARPTATTAVGSASPPPTESLRIAARLQESLHH